MTGIRSNQPMEGIMNLRALAFLGFAAFIAQPALAQTAPATTPTTFDSLQAAGYEIKAVTVMSDAATKEVFTGQTGLPSQIFITLQKGTTSAAVCEFATISWLNLDSGNMTDTTRCKMR
jgi:hypothetical protein